MLGLGCFAAITEDCVERFFGRVQFLFNFATEKFVVIRDWRLGLILRLLQIAILIYVLVSIISASSYLLQEVPKGVISPRAAVSGILRRENLIDQRSRYEVGELPYCGDASSAYDYRYNGVNYDNFQCVVMDALSIPKPGESEFFITTYLRVDKLYFVENPPGQPSCPDSAVVNLPDSAELLGNFFDVCLYNTYEQYFPIAPEEIPLEIVHSYYTSVVDKNGALPETIIEAVGDGGGRRRHFDSGETIRLRTSELLDVAGVDLDTLLNEQSNQNGLSETARDSPNDPFPFARLSGVNLILNFKYFHRSLAPDRYQESTGPKSRDVLCIVEVSPQYVWSEQGSDVQYQISEIEHPFFINPARDRLAASDEPRLESIQVDFLRNGVEFTFQVSGNLGRFDIFQLVNALVQGAVLLSVAQLIVTYIALYALGLSSNLYAEYMREQVNWRKEYARFAAQSLVAGSTFHQFDKNKSGALDRQEIYKYLTETFNEILDRPKMACLTDFLMRHGEMDVDVSRGRLDEVADIKISTINMAEWVDIFTEEKVKINSLNRLVDNEYSDPQIIDLLLRLAEGRNVRDLSHLVSGDIPEFEREDTTTGERLLPASGVSASKSDIPKAGSSKPDGGEP